MAVIAPTVVSTAASNWSDLSATDTTTTSISWQPGDIVIAGGMTEDGNVTFSGVPTATGLTFTNINNIGAAGSTVRLGYWIATPTSSGSATVSLGNSSTFMAGLQVWVIRGATGYATPTSATNMGNVKTNNVTRTKANSIVLGLMGDWAAVNDTVVDPTPTGTLRGVGWASGRATGFSMDWPDQGATGTTAYGITNHTGTVAMSFNFLEIFGTTDTPTATALGAALQTSGSPKTLAVAATPAGEWLLAYTAQYSAANAELTGVTAPGGAAMTQLGEVPTAANYHIEVWGLRAPPTGFASGNVTFTWSPAPNNPTMIGAARIAGVSPLTDPKRTAGVGAFRTTAGATTTTWTSGAITPTVGDVLFGVAFGDGVTDSADTGTPTNGFTELSDTNAAADDWGMVAAWKVAASTSEAYTGTWNTDPAFGDGAFVLALIPAIIPASGPATAAGQYGWGTYGLGDYGPNFGQTSSTPLSATDDWVMTEGATVIAITATAVVDSATQSEGTTVITTTDLLTANDSATQSEGTTSLSAALDASETHTQTDASALSTQLDLTANDSATLTEGATSLSDALATSESHSQVEGTTDVSAAVTSTGDSATQSEGTTITSASLDASETHTQTDSPASLSQQTAISATDTTTLTEGTTTLADSLDASESHSQVEGTTAVSASVTSTGDSATQSEGTTTTSAALDASEAHTQTDSPANIADQSSFSLNDSLTQTDNPAAIQTQNDMAANDSATQSEGTTSTSATLDAAETHTESEGTTAISATVTSTGDSATQSEGTTTLADTVSASDTQTQTDNPAVTQSVDLIVASETHIETEGTTTTSAALDASETHTQTDSPAAIASTNLVAVVDASTLAEASAIAATLATTDSSSFTDTVTFVGSQLSLSASDSATQSEGTSTVDTFDFKTVTDALALGETSAIAATLSASDQASATEGSSSLSVTLVATDTASQTEGTTTIAETKLISASDALTLTDTSSIQTVVFKALADAFAMDDAAFVFVPSPSPGVRLPTSAVIVSVSASAAVAAWSGKAALSAVVSQAAVAGHAYTVTITEKSGIAVVTAKMSNVNLDPNAP